MGTTNRSDWIRVSDEMTPVFEFVVNESIFRGRSVIQVVNEGPGATSDFLIAFRANDDDECPQTDYLGSDDLTMDNQGYLMNANVVFCTPDWPTIQPGETGAIVFIHQYCGRVQLFMRADGPGATVRVFTRG